MSNYGLRHDPKVITFVILSMLLPADIGRKMLKEANLGISEKTLQRIKNDIKNLGVEHIVEEVYKIYLLTTMDSLADVMKLKGNLFQIINDPNSNTLEKIKASQVLFNILRGIPDLYDPEISESIPSVYNVEKNEKSEANKKSDDNHDSHDGKQDTNQAGKNPDNSTYAGHDST